MRLAKDVNVAYTIQTSTRNAFRQTFFFVHNGKLQGQTLLAVLQYLLYEHESLSHFFSLVQNRYSVYQYG